MPNLWSFKYLPDILRAMTTSLLKSDKFRIYIYTPGVLVDPLIGYEFLCESVGFPFYTFNSAEEFYALQHNKTVQSIDYDPITLTFVIDTGMLGMNRAMELFINWGNMIRLPSGLFGYVDDYSSTIDINILDDSLSTFKTATLHKAYPVNLDTIEFSRDSGEQLATLSVSFVYSSITYE
jgi:hypothetical protein